MTACEAPNPSGGGNLSAQEIELTKEIYERVKSSYSFPFTRSDVSADDAFSEPSGYEQKAAPMPHPDAVIPPSQKGVPFPEMEPEFEQAATGDDLPF